MENSESSESSETSETSEAVSEFSICTYMSEGKLGTEAPISIY